MGFGGLWMSGSDWMIKASRDDWTGNMFPAVRAETWLSGHGYRSRHFPPKENGLPIELNCFSDPILWVPDVRPSWRQEDGPSLSLGARPSECHETCCFDPPLAAASEEQLRWGKKPDPWR